MPHDSHSAFRDQRLCLGMLVSAAVSSAAFCTFAIHWSLVTCPFISRSIWFWNSLYRLSYQSGNFQVMMFVPASFSILRAEDIEELVTEAPAPSIQVSELVSSENLSAAAFDAMMRRNSLPPGTFFAALGTTYCPAALARAA